MGVVCHIIGGLGEGRDGGGGWYAWVLMPGGFDYMSGDAEALRECDVRH